MRMSFKITLLRDEKCDPFISVDADVFDDDSVDINLYVKKDTSFEQFLNKNNILAMLKKSIKDMESDEEGFEYSIDAARKLLNTDLNLLDKIDSITIDDSDEMAEYIANNPIIKTYQIYLDGEYAISHEDYDEVVARFGNLKNVYLQVEGNDNLITMSEYGKTVIAIDDIVNKIRQYELSPLEQVMLAYDLVRDRIYKAEQENDSSTLSRDITSVLLGDKIVCVGFANIFDKVLSNLGFKTMMYSIKNVDETKSGHRRNIVYIKDEKYEVEGIYYFDTTWDCKKSVDDVEYLNSYRFFGKLKEDIEKYNPNFTDRTFEGYNDGMIWEFEEIVEDKGLKSVPKQMIKTFNDISEFIDGKPLINWLLIGNYPPESLPPFIKNSFNLEQVMEKLCEYRRLFFDEEIEIETLIKVWLTVRKIENSEQPEKYPLSIETLKKVILNSDWIPKSDYLANVKGFTKGRMFSSRQELEESISSFLNNYSFEDDTLLNIERERLVKVLKRVRGSKNGI